MSSPKEETFVAHLEALRAVLIRCLLALAVGIVPIFFITPYLMDMLIKVMMQNNDIRLNFFSPMEVFMLEVKMALVLDIVVCFPYMAKQMWGFIVPGLYENERRFVQSIVLSSSLLFIAGVLFCLFFILPLVVRFGLSFASEHIQAMFGISQMITLALWLSVVFGIMFQFPLVSFALIRFDVVDYETMKSKRAFVLVGILVMSALLTPPDIVSQLMLTLPTYGLFEIGLFLGRKRKDN